MKNFVLMLGSRIHKLFASVISLKFGVWIVASLLTFAGVLPGLYWFLFSIFVISARTFEKVLKAGYWKNG